ncbi:hypoxanthine-guanine phosphoribosyltransferase [Gilvimarinus sp. F26214L]|uniref:hypoxanthine-guanine phosphoribosyltransferase n=1 Tax=Gilvimarinus sp. DZF01 TaxID=3461371 RepID=UPI0040458FBF
MSSERFSAGHLIENSDLLYTQGQIDEAIAALARDINAQLAGGEWLMLCVMNGGVAFSTQLMFHLSMPLRWDYIHATRYGEARQGGRLDWHAQAREVIEGRRVLLADDILDEGYTLQALTRWCRDRGAADVKTAVMVQKDHARNRAMKQADFTALTVPDRFVFGYGMDLEGYGRNLPGIYAVRDKK